MRPHKSTSRSPRSSSSELTWSHSHAYELTLGAVNVFNKAPASYNNTSGYDTANAEPLGRVVTFSGPGILVELVRTERHSIALRAPGSGFLGGGVGPHCSKWPGSNGPLIAKPFVTQDMTPSSISVDLRLPPCNWQLCIGARGR
jgi:hypothetical protein